MLRTKFIFDVVAPTLLLCWTLILVYSAVASDTGYNALHRLQDDIAAKTAEVDALHAHRAALEKTANQLSSGSLDPDLADQRIREILGYSRDGDVIISRHEIKQLIKSTAPKG